MTRAHLHHVLLPLTNEILLSPCDSHYGQAVTNSTVLIKHIYRLGGHQVSVNSYACHNVCLRQKIGREGETWTMRESRQWEREQQRKQVKLVERIYYRLNFPEVFFFIFISSFQLILKHAPKNAPDCPVSQTRGRKRSFVCLSLSGSQTPHFP